MSACELSFLHYDSREANSLKQGRIEKAFTKMSLKLEKSQILNEMVQSFVALIPVFLIGAFTLVLQNFPIPSVAGFINYAWGGLINK